MTKKDYYTVLGLSKGASDREIKEAYRRLALKYHPDQNKGDKEAEARFKELSEAYKILKDPEKRAAYDQMGHRAFDGSMGGGGFSGAPGGFDFHFKTSGGGGFDIFEDVLDELMGGRARGSRGQSGARQNRGADLRFDMALTLEEAFAGLKTEVSLSTWVGCGTCHKTGAQKGAKPSVCRACGGRGVVASQQGFFVVDRPCGACKGMGQRIDNPCRTCSGEGRVREKKKIAVQIPAGIESGARVRLMGEGEAGLRGAPSGDLFIFIKVKPHDFFERDGRDLLCTIPISMITAALGGTLEVPTIEGGRVRLSVPEGTQSGHRFRVRLKGMSVLKSTLRGDLYVQTAVETPVRLSKEQKEILKQFQEKADNQPKVSKFWDKVKSLFG
ncbi:MAG: molecular chaperone DnaJ [Holosporaceae bacterium]